MKKKFLLGATALIMGGFLWILPATAQTGGTTDEKVLRTATLAAELDEGTLNAADTKALTDAKALTTKPDEIIKLAQATGDHLILTAKETDTGQGTFTGTDTFTLAKIEPGVLRE